MFFIRSLFGVFYFESLYLYVFITLHVLGQYVAQSLSCPAPGIDCRVFGATLPEEENISAVADRCTGTGPHI